MAGEAVLVTGGAGFIGSALCRALLQGGHEVVVFDNLSMGRRELLPAHGGCRIVEGDVREAAAVERLVTEVRPGRVFHLAAIHYIPYCNAHPVDTMDVNVTGTRNLLNACRRLPPRLFFLASTAAVYPAEGSPFRETSPVGPIDVYGRTKALAEDVAQLFLQETGIPTVAGRLFNAFGPNDTNPHLIPDVLAQVRRGADVLELGNLEPVRDYVHVDDVVAGILAAAEAATKGFDVFNIGSGRGQSVRQVVAAVESALGRPLRILQAPDRLRKVERQELVSDVTKLREASGWRPQVEFARGIAALVATDAAALR
jgi:UDP-glucose 4-epimerase